MSAPFANSRDKITWAKCNIKGLQKDLDTWKKAQGGSAPYTFAMRTHSGDYSIALVVEQVKRMPKSWGLRASNIVNDLRAALDYAAWEIVPVGIKSKLSPKDAAGIYFPIAFTNKSWDTTVGKSLPGASPEHLAVIEKYQPFKLRQAGGSAKLHPFSLLQSVSSVDKHLNP